MEFYSTKNKNHIASFQEAVVSGLAPDGGLYMPVHIPKLSHHIFNSFSEKTLSEIALDICFALIGNGLSKNELTHFINSAISFDAPLVMLSEDTYVLELFHGPTFAFKDFGARFMSQILSHYAKTLKKEVVILAATSGDTGSAVANGFYQVDGTRVVILYPAGKVSNIQEKQFATLGHNITSIAIEGSFDDCQRLVKRAFQDQDLRQQFFLTSANSINIARLIPQVFYYCFAWSRLQTKKPIVFSVPSGNFGNLTAGLIAKRMGLPIEHFIASTNSNDVIPNYLNGGKFEPRSSQQTISNAMDVGDPSNFIRILDLYEHNLSSIKKDLTAFSVSDEETIAAMKKVYERFQYMLDPHGAVAYVGLERFAKMYTNNTGVFLETAYPAKFIEVVEEALNKKIVIPEALANYMDKENKSISCSSDFIALQKTLFDVLK